MASSNAKETEKSVISLEMSRCSSMCGGMHMIDSRNTTNNDNLSDAKSSPSALNSSNQNDSVIAMFGFTIPPSGYLAKTLTGLIGLLLIWAALWSVIGNDLFPGGNIFSIYIVVVFSAIGGRLIESIPRITLPALLGQLIIGLMLRNVPGIDVAKTIDKKWSSTLRSFALAVILMRSGLGLNTEALKKLKFTVIRLAFGPAVAETVTTAVLTHYLLGIKWLWSFQLG